MRYLSLALAAVCIGLVPGCLSVTIGTEDNPKRFQMEGLATAYVAASQLHGYNGKILEFGLFKDTKRDGEIVSLDIWPLAGIGLGIVGARVRVLPIEIGAGALFYKPEAEAAEPCPAPEPEAEGT